MTAGSGVKRLHELRPGESGWIETIEGGGGVMQRLMDMAMLPGAAVEVLRLAPFGDPILLKLGSARLSLRRKDAACVVVRL